jgi:vancomycin resistance protein VanW
MIAVIFRLKGAALCAVSKVIVSFCLNFKMNLMMKRLIPASVRCSARIALRSFTDLKTGHRSRFVKSSKVSKSVLASLSESDLFVPWIKITQEIKASDYSENKKHNLTIAAQRINRVLIRPNELFSFWHLVGQPNRRNGYLPGRTLVNQTLKAEYGGGLCQLSGLLYYLALKAGLQINERYPHSVDIYTDETRFTPLGSDATVVYGYKDFRFFNTLQQPICFHIDVQSDAIVGQLCAREPMTEHRIEFKSRHLGQQIEVETLRQIAQGSFQESLGKSTYHLPKTFSSCV